MIIKLSGKLGKGLSIISNSLTEFDSVKFLLSNRRSNVAPCLSVSWDPTILGLMVVIFVKLEMGNPDKMSVGDSQFSVNPYMMEHGEDEQVALRLKQIFSES